MAYQQYNHWTPMYEGVNTNRTNPRQFAYKPNIESRTLELGPEDSEIPEYRKQTFQQRYLGGLKRTLRAFVVVACIVLLVNVSWLGYAKEKYGIKDGYGTIKQGDCASMKQLNTWLHLLINILSTLLLTGSNAFMATYSGPTREEIDEAHAMRRWLHVGSMSFRNMRGIAKRKSFIVLILGMSSIPFHLLYNSLVFTSLSANNYYWAVVTEDFLRGSPFNLTGNWQNTSWGYYEIDLYATLPDDDYSDQVMFTDDPDTFKYIDIMNNYFTSIQHSAPTWERLDQKDCINAYSNAFVSSRRNVALVSTNKSAKNSILTYGSSDIDADLDGNWWICSSEGQNGGFLTCNAQDYLANASSWTVYGNPIEYCLSEKVDDICSVHFSMIIMLVVVAFNAIKVIVMCWVLFRLDAEKILASVGDAAESFLKHPDKATLGMCLADKRGVDNFWRAPGLTRPFNDRTRGHWGQAISRKRWILFFLLMIFSWCVVFFFGAWGFVHVKNQGIALTPSGLWTLGFGTINQHAMVLADNATNAVVMSIVANIPQIFLSVIYLMYMGIMSAMFMAADWAKFALAPQTLIVSSPVGKQRGTWLLGAPLAYGIGLLALQTLLHWFISQSIFVVQIYVYDKLGHLDASQPAILNCGYSPIAIVFSVVASGVLVLTAFFFMRRKFRPGSPPVVSTCSAAISASCHVPPSLNKDSAVYQELQWGVTVQTQNSPRHCSLAPVESWKSDQDRRPVGGYLYAG